MKITVIGAGYVGLSTAVLLARFHEVTVVDLAPERVAMINRCQAPFSDESLARHMKEVAPNLTAVTDGTAACAASDFLIVAVPTDYDPATGRFDTDTVDTVIEEAVRAGITAAIIIRSTVPIGYTQMIRQRTKYPAILFCPEFLRENRAMEDVLHPSRIVVGTDLQEPALLNTARAFAATLQQCGKARDSEPLITGYREAEAIKLFSNTYLALRVCFFNELDTFAELNGLDTAAMIRGVCLDPRIGGHYNNPSFGYGGYCLPKDTRQLLANYSDIPQALIGAVVSANQTRKDHIASQIIKRIQTMKPAPTVGIYRLTMKTGSDNFRNSSVLGIMERLLEHRIELAIYEPQLGAAETFLGCTVIRDLDRFKKTCGIILANRFDAQLEDVKHIVYSRDLFRRD